MIRRIVLPIVALTMVMVGSPGALLSQPLPQAAAPASVGMDPDRLDRIGAMFDAYLEEGQLVGGVVLVARQGKLVYHHAFGERDQESGDPMEPDDLFRIASQSKALTSVAIMMLMEEGKLLLSDPLGRFLPEFMETTVAVPSEDGGYEVVPANRPVNIRDLLTHTAGVGYGNGPGGEAWQEAGITGWYLIDRDVPIREAVRPMAELPFQAQPGEAWVYGYATDILGAVVEEASGMPFDAFLQERILEPLGMNDTHFFIPPDAADRLVTVYSLGQDQELRRAPDGTGMVAQGEYLEGPRTTFSGGAGLVSTAADYGRFLQMLLNGGELDGQRLLSPKSVELMTVDHCGDACSWPGRGFGLGVDVVDDLGAFGRPGTVGRYGWGGAYHSTYWVDPAEELVVVYLTQLIPAWVDDHARLEAMVYQAIVESGS